VVQAPPSGELIVLGPDHPVTGGYPVLGILGPEACDALFARPLGSEVALCLVP
jgi:allophanate hydrolase subunit 2